MEDAWTIKNNLPPDFLLSYGWEIEMPFLVFPQKNEKTKVGKISAEENAIEHNEKTGVIGSKNIGTVSFENKPLWTITCDMGVIELISKKAIIPECETFIKKSIWWVGFYFFLYSLYEQSCTENSPLILVGKGIGEGVATGLATKMGFVENHPARLALQNFKIKINKAFYIRISLAEKGNRVAPQHTVGFNNPSCLPNFFSFAGVKESFKKKYGGECPWSLTKEDEKFLSESGLENYDISLIEYVKYIYFCAFRKNESGGLDNTGRIWPKTLFKILPRTTIRSDHTVKLGRHKNYADIQQIIKQIPSDIKGLIINNNPFVKSFDSSQKPSYVFFEEEKKKFYTENITADAFLDSIFRPENNRNIDKEISSTFGTKHQLRRHRDYCCYPLFASGIEKCLGKYSQSAEEDNYGEDYLAKNNPVFLMENRMLSRNEWTVAKEVQNLSDMAVSLYEMFIDYEEKFLKFLLKYEPLNPLIGKQDLIQTINLKNKMTGSLDHSSSTKSL